MTLGLAEGKFRLSISPLVIEETQRNLARSAPEALPSFALLRQLLSAGQVTPSKDIIRQAEELVERKSTVGLSP